MTVKQLGQDVPAVGRTVHYWLADHDRAAGAYVDAPDQAPAFVPAVMTRVYLDQSSGTFQVNLFVIRDLGPPFGLENVPHGREPGCWSWPVRGTVAGSKPSSPLIDRATANGR